MLEGSWFAYCDRKGISQLYVPQQQKTVSPINRNILPRGKSSWIPLLKINEKPSHN